MPRRRQWRQSYAQQGGFSSYTAGKAGQTNATRTTYYGSRRAATVNSGESGTGRGNKLINRRQRDYDMRKAMNNDQRSPEAIARLRAMGINVQAASAISVG